MSVAIVREKKSNDEWSVKSSISVPMELFVLLKSKSIPFANVSSLGPVGLAEETFHVRTKVEFFELLVADGKVLICSNCEDIPLSENQLGYMLDLEMIEW